MKIREKRITVGEVFEGYINYAEEGLRGYGGRLDISPRYQREFIYKDKQRPATPHSFFSHNYLPPCAIARGFAAAR